MLRQAYNHQIFASSTVIFIIMVIVLLVRPAGLFGTQK